MYAAMTEDVLEALDKIGQITEEHSYDPRLVPIIAQLKATAASVMSSSQGLDDMHLRSSVHAVADGILAAAEICNRLQDRRI
jgi:hypothetical protein